MRKTYITSLWTYAIFCVVDLYAMSYMLEKYHAWWVFPTTVLCVFAGCAAFALGVGCIMGLLDDSRKG